MYYSSCTGPLLEELEGGVTGLEVAVKGGLADKNYVYLVMCLTSELKQLLSLNETVTEPAGVIIIIIISGLYSAIIINYNYLFLQVLMMLNLFILSCVRF